MSRLNELRYGCLEGAQRVMDGDDALTEAELRALVFNLVDRVEKLQGQIENLALTGSRFG